MATLSARALALMLSDWRDDNASAYTALADRIRLLVLDGRVSVGTRLPAERELSAALEVSRTTVSASYAELREAGYLTSTRGSGSVARLPGPVAVPNDTADPELLDFTMAAMPTYSGVAAAAEQAVRQLPAYLGEHGFDPIGLPALREAVAARFSSRGLPTSADQIMITIGAQHAIALLSRTLIGRGDAAIIESPTYHHAQEALLNAGARLIPVSVSAENGWDAGALEQAFQRSSPALAYLMPDFHNPTGQSMPTALRQRTAQLAARHGTRLIVDETMAELSLDDDYAAEPFAVHGDAITVGSVGKTVWGGVRVGWIRAEPALIQKLARKRLAGDLGTPMLEQLIVLELLQDFERVLVERRAQLREGRAHLIQTLARYLPEWEVPDADGGLLAWINIGAPVSSQLTMAARREGLALTAGPRFGLDGAFERFVRLPYCRPPEDIERAVAILASAWGSLSHLSQPEPRAFELVV